jgi:membrane protein implicated in regulation of membrane protease activity
LATKLTMFVGTIWAFYVFVIFGLTPVFWPSYETQILYWSNFLQLVFLPIITVGTAILSRDAQARAEQDHETIQQEFALLKQAQGMLDKSLNEIGAGVKELLIEARRSRKEG